VSLLQRAAADRGSAEAARPAGGSSGADGPVPRARPAPDTGGPAPAGGGPSSPAGVPPPAAGRRAPGPGAGPWGGEVVFAAGPARLAGHLSTPGGGAGMVVFAHGSGSSRRSPRNRFVADVLATAGLGTLLFDLLTAEEEQDRANVFDIGLLASRLGAVTRWVHEQPGLAGARVGYFGASTGAAAALWAAAEPGAEVA